MPMNPKAQKSDFMLLLRQPNTGPHPGTEEMEKIMARFTTWMEDMTAKGIVLGTAGLEVAGKVLRRSGEIVITDGPYPEATEIVGGYVLITATDLDAAAEIARNCPGLDYRMVVEVRPLKYRKK